MKYIHYKSICQKKLHSVCFDKFHMLFSNMFFFPPQHSPSGKLVQIEYALSAVAAGAPSVGIKGMSVDHKLHRP